MTARIQTYTGLMVDPMHLSLQDIRLEDIAHALSNLCRFTGHTSRFYSVAEHCVHASRVAAEWATREALLHDASEAYLQDIPTPIKQCNGMEFYRAAEKRAQRAVSARFGVGALDSVYVRQADVRMLHYEGCILMPGGPWDHDIGTETARLLGYQIFGLHGPTPVEAERMFLSRARELGLGD